MDLLLRGAAENRDFSLLIAQLFGRTDVRMAGTRLLKVIDSHPGFHFFPYRVRNNRAPVDTLPLLITF